MSSTSLRLVFALVMLCVAGAASAAQVQHVDCAAGPFFDIQTAINAATNGDIIVVHPCTAAPGYYPGFVVSGRSNLQIVGADQAASVISAYPIGVNSSAPNAAASIFTVAGRCVFVEDSVNISVIGLILKGCADHGFEVRSSRVINLHGNSLYYSGAHGATIRGSRFIKVTGNLFQKAKKFAVFTDVDSRYVQIEANRILFNDNGVNMEGTAIDVANNEVRLNVHEGIVVRSRLSKVSRNWSAGNGASQINFLNWPLAFDNCVVGNFMGGAGLTPAISTTGCQAENF